MKISSTLKKATMLFCISMIVFLPVVAVKNAPEPPLADLIINQNEIHIVPLVSYRTISLSVVLPDGQLVRKEYAAGEVVLFRLPPNASDGFLAYEIKVTPPGPEMGKRSTAENRNAGLLQSEKGQVQSGRIQVSQGTIIHPSQPEQLSSPMDVLHYDDVIVTGSLCVGFDCINGESFGYCTTKLKENNLQLCFEDTSVGSFPTNDWKIQINDTTSGGASYFTIWDTDGGKRPFTIEAGAPAHALYVEDYGRIGLGTSIPYVELHIVDGDSPTIRLDQDGSSGWSPQSWDMCGNETNLFIRDVTNGSKLCFRIQPDTPSNTLCMRSTGFVGLGTWSPAYKLHAQTTGENCTLVTERTDGAIFKLDAKLNRVQIGSVSNHDVRFTTNGTNRVAITTAGNVGIGELTPTHLLDVGTSGAYCNGGAWVDGSSLAFKQDIQSINTEEATKAVMNLRPVRFRYKSDTSEEFLGFIAEEVPELVAMKDRKGMTAMDVVAALTKVVQQQQETISRLEKRISSLEKK